MFAVPFSVMLRTIAFFSGFSKNVAVSSEDESRKVEDFKFSAIFENLLAQYDSVFLILITKSNPVNV